MADKRNGNDFTSGTRAVLGKRVGYKCSRCGKSTLSLHSDPEKVIDIGEGAHICAASPGGPRYDETMTSDQIKSAENGIFLCRECHAIIDRDPEEYPVEKLKKMKEDAENNANFSYVLTKYDRNQQRSLRRYYESAIETFEEKRNDFISDESLAESYIMPMIGEKSLLDLVWEWYEDTPYGVLLLYGQPGHGKTTICQKAVYDYAKHTEHAAEEALVLQFPLNQAKSNLIDDFDKGSINLENVFHRPGKTVPYVELDDCDGKLIFLDGYDEVKYLLAEHTRYKTLQEFIGTENSSDDRLMCLAKEYKIHFVITSRVNALSTEDINSVTSIELPILTTNQQEQWCARKVDYKNRWDDTLSSICMNEDEEGTIKELKELLQIPYIFRMVVHTDYQISEGISNRAALFKDLFSKTVERNKLYVEKNLEHPVSSEELSIGYQNLAYKIWCDNEDSASDIENSAILLLAYYIKEDSTHGRYSFIHKSFYDYYMALYLYEQMKKCSNASETVCEEFLAKLAERRIDGDILNLFEEVVKNSSEKEIVLSGAKTLLESLSLNEAIGIDTKKKDEIVGTSEKSRFNRCNNIFVNVLNIVVLAGEKELCKYKNIVLLFSKYRCERMFFDGVNLSETDLNNANLIRSSLNGADLSRAVINGTYLDGASLNGANLSGAIVIGTSLESATLRAANLDGTYLRDSYLKMADLRNADLSGASLRDADLREADFRGANIRSADFSGAIINKACILTSDKEYLEYPFGIDLNNVDWFEDVFVDSFE